VVKYFQQVKGVPLRSETLIVGAWYSMEPDWVLPLCQRLPSPWSELHNDYIIFYRIHFQSLADLSTPVKSHRIPGTTISGLIHVLEIHYYFLSDIFSFRQLCSTQ
jgi:hypothetical protein